MFGAGVLLAAKASKQTAFKGRCKYFPVRLR